MRGFLITLITLLTTFTAANSSVIFIPFSETDKKVTDFPFIGQIVNINNGICGSGTVIYSGEYVLTARHVITATAEEQGLLLDSSNFVFVLGGKTYTIEKVYGSNNVDLAILKLKEKAPVFAEISKTSFLFGHEFYGVGFGRSISIPDMNDLKWDLSYGTLRHFKNRIEGEYIDIVGKNGVVTVRDLLMFTLEKEDSLNQAGGSISGEGMHGPGDSGGGIFILEEGKLKLAAVVSALTTKAPYMGLLSKIHPHLDWINICTGNISKEEKPSVMSEPRLFQFRLVDPVEAAPQWALKPEVSRRRRSRR